MGAGQSTLPERMGVISSLLGYQLGVLLILLLVFLNVVTGLRAFLRLNGFRRRPPTNPPQLSVLVSTHNHANRIQECLTSLLGQDYPNLEVIVLDEGSSDSSVLVAAAVAEHDLRVRIVRGKPRPEGWTARAWAREQLVQEAHGEYLLFSDATLVYHPQTLMAAVEAMEFHGADMLALWPGHCLSSFPARLLMPLWEFVLFCLLPLRLRSGVLDTDLLPVHHHAFLVRRSAYELTGGYRTVRTLGAAEAVLLALGRRLGRRVLLLDASDMITDHPTDPVDDAWEHLSNGLLVPFKHSWVMLLTATVLLGALFVLPYAFVLAAVSTQQTAMGLFWLPLYQIAVIIAIRGLLAQRFAHPLEDVLLHPIAVVFLQLLILRMLHGDLRRRSAWVRGLRARHHPSEDHVMTDAPSESCVRRDD